MTKKELELENKELKKRILELTGEMEEKNPLKPKKINAETMCFYEHTMVDATEEKLFISQFGDYYPIPYAGDEMSYHVYSSLEKIKDGINTLENPSPNGNFLRVCAIDSTLSKKEIDVAVDFESDVSQRIHQEMVNSIHDSAKTAAEIIESNAVEKLSLGTNVVYSSDYFGERATSMNRINDSSHISLDDLEFAEEILRNMRADKIGNAYILFVSEKIFGEISAFKGFVYKCDYHNPEIAFNGEVGQIGSVRIISCPSNILKTKTSRCGHEVASSFMIGSHAFAVSEVYDAIDLKISENENGRFDAKWVVRYDLQRLVEQYIVRIESVIRKEK